MSQRVKHYDGNTVRDLTTYVDAPPLLGQRAGRWYGPTGASTTLLVINDRLYLSPFVLQRRRLPAAIGVYVNTVGSAGALLRFGIFADSDGTPTTLVEDCGTVTAETTGMRSKTPTKVLDPGLYWLGVVSQGAPATAPVLRSVSSGNLMVGLVNPGNLYSSGYYNSSGVAGALATLNTTSMVDAVNAPATMLQM